MQNLYTISGEKDSVKDGGNEVTALVWRINVREALRFSYTLFLCFAFNSHNKQRRINMVKKRTLDYFFIGFNTEGACLPFDGTCG
jgi:hypothetical protein